MPLHPETSAALKAAIARTEACLACGLIPDPLIPIMRSIVQGLLPLMVELERLQEVERHARALVAVRAEYLRGKGPPGLIEQAVLEKRADDAADALSAALKE